MLDNISILPAGHLKKTQNKILLKHPLTTVAQSTALVQRLGRSESCSVTILWVGRPPPSPVFSSPSQRTKSQHFSANKPDQQPETINSMRNQRGKEIAALLTTHTHTHTQDSSPIGTTATVRTLNWKNMALGKKCSDVP